MQNNINLFQGPIGSWQRGWFSFYFDQIQLSQEGKRLLAGLIRKHPDINPDIIVDLVKYITAAGLMEGADKCPVPYDGSRIDQASPYAHQILQKGERGLLMEDLVELRSKKCSSLTESLSLLDKFFRENKFLSGFPHGDNFWKEYPFGIFRAEGLFSLFDIEDIDLESYLDFLSINFKEKYKIFQERFWEVHKTRGFPIDHDEDRNIFVGHGLTKEIGKVTMDGQKKRVYLRVSPGNGEGYAGIAFNVVVDDPATNLFDVAFNLVRENGNIYPKIVKIQRMPLQLDKDLSYREDFVEHHDFPGNKKVSKMQKAISELLEGDVFCNLLMAVASYYQSRGFVFIGGISGEANKWIMYHTDEIVENQEGGEEVALKRARSMYDERFRKLGWYKVGNIWGSALDNGHYCQILENGLFPFKLEQGEIVKVQCTPDKQKKVTLPRFRSLITEKGLARLIEHLGDLIYVPEVDEKTFVDIIHILRSIRKKEEEVETKRSVPIFDAKNPLLKKRT